MGEGSEPGYSKSRVLPCGILIVDARQPSSRLVLRDVIAVKIKPLDACDSPV